MNPIRTLLDRLPRIGSQPLLPALGLLALAPLAPALAPIASGYAPGSPGAPRSEPRVIVLGFDGTDGSTTQALMESGALPNLRRLAEQGTFAHLDTTCPPESPVAWASLNSGRNPGKTGVPGFVRRQLVGGSRTPSPTFGHIDTDTPRPLEECRNAPIPTWRAWKLALVSGVAVLAISAFLFLVLLRMKAALSIALALVLGAGAGWGGFTLRQYLPGEMPVMRNRVECEPFWETAARAGVPSIVLAAAQCFDRAEVEGAKVLSGLGVPDARGSVQSFFVYTTDDMYFTRSINDKMASTGSGGKKLRVDEHEGVIETSIWGPVNFWQVERLEAQIAELELELDEDSLGYQESLTLQDEKALLEEQVDDLKKEPLSLPLRVERGEDSAVVSIGTEKKTLRPGEWSDWYHLTFELNPLIKVKAITRVQIQAMDPEILTLFVDALQIDPAAPPFWQPISQPHCFASQLAEKLGGPYETIGWACMTMPFKDELLDPVSFMQDIQFTFELRERMSHVALERDDWRIMMTVLSTPDRTQHMMYQYYDAEHPLYEEEQASRTMEFFGETIELRDAIPAIYRQVDRFVGEVMERHLGAEDTLLICSDHGFHTFQRQVHVNNWLAEKGYLVPRQRLKNKIDGRYLSTYVDWSKTRAYSLGLGMVYLNLEGREGGGIVKPSEAADLMQQITADFLATTDPATGDHIGKQSFAVRDVHSGPYLDREADMILGFANGYRVSWSTTMGGCKLEKGDEGVGYRMASPYEDNLKNWSGDHVSMAPEIVTGTFFCNRKVEIPEDGVNIMQIAPTVLDLMGVARPEDYDFEPLKMAD